MKIDSIVENCLCRFATEYTEKENIYKQYIYDEDIEKSFEEELDIAIKKSKTITDYNFTYAGGFSSCGYSISCYVLSVIQKGKLITIPINFEDC